jgi:hypothetical protein
MFEKLKDSVRSWVVDQVLGQLLGSAVVGAIFYAVTTTWSSLPLVWRIVLALSVFLLSYVGLLKYGERYGWGVKALAVASASTKDSASTNDARRAQIAAWREMVADVHRTQLAYGDHRPPVTGLLERRAAFFSLKPYLTKDTLQAIQGRMVAVPPSRSTMDGALHRILHDIDDLEVKWGLR